MPVLKRHPVIVLDRNAVEEYLEADRREGEKEVGSKCVKVNVKEEGVSEILRVKNETEYVQNDVMNIPSVDDSLISKQPFVSELVVEIKTEKEEKGDVTHELVDFFPDHALDKNQKHLSTIKHENIKNEYTSDDEPEICFDSNASRRIMSAEFVVRVKKEEELSEITHELVGYHPNHSSDENKKPHLEIKFEGIACENQYDYSSYTGCNSETFDAHAYDENIFSDTREELSNLSEVQSKLCFDSSSAEERDTDERITFLSSATLGEVYSNKNPCLYVHDEYESSKDTTECLPENQRTGNFRECSNSNLETAISDEFSEDPTFDWLPETAPEPTCRSNVTFASAELNGAMEPNGKTLVSEELSVDVSKKDTFPVLIKLLSDDRPFKCDKCPAKLKKRDYLIRHLTIHSDDKPFKCAQCTAEFKQNRYLTKHMPVHSHERPFKCDGCSFQFKRRSDLQKHVKVCKKERIFKCHKCLQSFKNHIGLIEHVKLTDNKSCALARGSNSQNNDLPSDAAIRSKRTSSGLNDAMEPSGESEISNNLLIDLPTRDPQLEITVEPMGNKLNETSNFSSTIASSEKTTISDELLENLPLTALNYTLKSYPKEVIQAYKEKRRYLRNRRYAQNCILRRRLHKKGLERQNEALKTELSFIKEEIKKVKGQCTCGKVRGIFSEEMSIHTDEVRPPKRNDTRRHFSAKSSQSKLLTNSH